jgi:hypothetical protein
LVKINIIRGGVGLARRNRIRPWKEKASEAEVLQDSALEEEVIGSQGEVFLGIGCGIFPFFSLSPNPTKKLPLP